MNLSKIFDDAALEEYATNFLGYGRPDAPVWFVGMEEGGGNSFEEVQKRISVWAHLGKNSLEDIFRYHLAIGIDEWFAGPRPNLQSTWSGLVRLQLGLIGKDPAVLSPEAQRELTRDYQQNRLGRSDGNERLMELLPLPSPSTQDWLYARHSKIHWLTDRETYARFQIPRRVIRIQEEIDRYEPKFVIFYGLAFEDHWTRIARTQFVRTAIEKTSIANRTSTLLAIVPHPVAYGLSADYFFRVGRYLALAQSGLEASAVLQRSDFTNPFVPIPTQQAAKERLLNKTDEGEVVWSGEKNRRTDYFQGVILASDKVKLLVAPGDRKGARGESLKRKTNAYVKTALTVQEYIRRGLRKDDLAWDYEREFISIVDETGTEIKWNPTRTSVAAFYTKTRPK